MKKSSKLRKKGRVRRFEDLEGRARVVIDR